MDLASLTRLNAERCARRAVILVTDLANGHVRVITESEAIDDLLSEVVRDAFRSGRSQTVAVEGRTLFLNVHLPPPRMVVIGAVHISQTLAPMAHLTGFDVAIIDPRTAFATPERFGSVRLYAEWPETVLARWPLDPFTALVAVTHDPKIDDLPLQAALAAQCFYVGALGSRKTHTRRVERLLTAGVATSDIERIHAPIGLNIGASTPAEIAIAVLAQTIQTLRSRGLAGRDKGSVE